MLEWQERDGQVARQRRGYIPFFLRPSPLVVRLARVVVVDFSLGMVKVFCGSLAKARDASLARCAKKRHATVSAESDGSRRRGGGDAIDECRTAG
jgi:hypothetical protein